MQEWETARRAFYTADDKLNAHCAASGKQVLTCDNCGKLMLKQKSSKTSGFVLDFCSPKCQNHYLGQ